MGLSNQYRADRHEQLCLSMKTSKGSISLPIDASAQSFSVKPPWSYGHGQASMQDLLSMKTSKGSTSLPIDASAQSFSVEPPWSYGHGQASIQDLHVKWEGLTISVAIDGAIVSPSLFTRADT